MGTIEIAVIALIITNLASLAYIITNHLKRREHARYEQVVREWLKVHLAFQKASHAVIEIKKLDTDSLMYWKS